MSHKKEKRNRAIVKAHEEGDSMREIAREFGISAPRVHKIIHADD